MRPQRYVCCLVALFALMMTSMSAQTTGDWNTVKSLTTGTQVRVTAGSHTVHGEISQITDDVLGVTSEKGQEMFDRQQISVVSVRKPSHRKRNTLIGFGTGTGFGLGVGIAARAGRGQWELVSNNAVTAVFTAAGAIFGTIVGAVIPTGGWREIYKK